MGESIGAIWQKPFNESGMIALSPSIFHNGQMMKILYLVTEDWFFASHFLPMARAAREAGLEVVVAARVRNHAGELAGEGLRVIPLDIERKSLGVLAGLRNIVLTYRIVRAERPDIVHCIALRPIVLGGPAARLAGAPSLVLAPTGLGQLWIEHGIVARVMRSISRFMIARLRGSRTRFLFENRDDPREFGLDPAGPEVTIVGGAGVDPAEFPAVPEPPSPPVKVAVVSRMIAAKGIADTVEAVRRARSEGAPVELHLYGAPDPSNRDAISEELLRRWSSEPGIAWHGRTEDVARVWREHHVALLLSYYREGLPRTLLEAAAAGRPIVTTDAPGCRELVRHRQEGLLVPPRDIEAAARALAELAADPALRQRLGMAASARVKGAFTEEAIRRSVGGLYRGLLSS
jgi:glycosyltransferase involved in cell wall biosynthesis